MSRKIVLFLSLSCNVVLVWFLLANISISHENNAEDGYSPPLATVESVQSSLPGDEVSRSEVVTVVEDEPRDTQPLPSIDSEPENDKNEYVDTYFVNDASLTRYEVCYGKWKIIRFVSPEIAKPAAFFRIYNDKPSSWDVTSIVGEIIEFKYDCAWYYGQRHEYAYKPRTYTQILKEDALIGSNYAKTLGIEGTYYAKICFVLDDNPDYLQTEAYERHPIGIADFTSLNIKDANTIYASFHGLLFLLERVE